MAVNPMLFNILELMANLLGTIREGDDAGEGEAGYNFDWNPSNMFDAAQMKPGPNASLYFKGEQPLDEEQGNNGGLYDNLADVEIEVQFIYDVPPENPMWAGQRDILRCQEDLKRFMEHKREALSAAGLFDVYRPKDREPVVHYSSDNSNPARLIMPWRIQYSQSRKEPELVG